MATHENLTPATLGSFFLMHLYGYPSNSGVPQQLWGSGEISLTGSLYLSLGLSLTLTHSHTRALSHTLYILSLTHSLTTTLPLSHSLSSTLTKMIGENYLFLQTSRLPLI